MVLDLFICTCTVHTQRNQGTCTLCQTCQPVTVAVSDTSHRKSPDGSSGYYDQSHFYYIHKDNMDTV